MQVGYKDIRFVMHKNDMNTRENPSETIVQLPRNNTEQQENSSEVGVIQDREDNKQLVLKKSSKLNNDIKNAIEFCFFCGDKSRTAVEKVLKKIESGEVRVERGVEITALDLQRYYNKIQRHIQRQPDHVRLELLRAHHIQLRYQLFESAGLPRDRLDCLKDIAKLSNLYTTHITVHKDPTQDVPTEELEKIILNDAKQE